MCYRWWTQLNPVPGTGMANAGNMLTPPASASRWSNRGSHAPAGPISSHLPPNDYLHIASYVSACPTLQAQRSNCLCGWPFWFPYGIWLPTVNTGQFGWYSVILPSFQILFCPGTGLFSILTDRHSPLCTSDIITRAHPPVQHGPMTVPVQMLRFPTFQPGPRPSAA